jgi:hypothetical protein
MSQNEKPPRDGINFAGYTIGAGIIALIVIPLVLCFGFCVLSLFMGGTSPTP